MTGIPSTRPLAPLAALAALAALLVLGACSEGSGSSPTGPGPFDAQTATVSGTVTSGGAPAGGVEVGVDGLAGTVVTDSAGRFELSGVAPGDRVLGFETGAARATLVIPDVRPDETIELTVALSGTHAQVRSMRRTAPGTGDLVLSFAPGVWNPLWAGSSGQVQAFVRGPGHESIDAGSVLLYGDDPALPPLAPRRSRVEGEHLKATFGKAAALALLPDPQPGEIRVLRLEFLLDGVPTALTASISFTADPGPGSGPLRVSIQPDSWNLNWDASSGTVSAKIEGAGFDQIDPASIRLVGSDPTALPLEPVRSERRGNHVRAFFAKADALALLDTPAAGETHAVRVEFLLGGAPGQLDDTVRVVGS